MHLSFSIVYKSGLGNKTLLSTIGLTQLRSIQRYLIKYLTQTTT